MGAKPMLLIKLNRMNDIADLSTMGNMQKPIEQTACARPIKYNAFMAVPVILLLAGLGCI